MSGTRALIAIGVVFLIFALFRFFMKTGIYETIVNLVGGFYALMITSLIVIAIVGGIIQKIQN